MPLDSRHPSRPRRCAIRLPEQIGRRLDPSAGWADVLPLPAGSLASHPISPAANHPRHARPELLRPVVASLFG